jgi:hypothetical protein
MCDSFKTLCLKCDSYIHSLPYKRMHKRQAIEEVTDEDNIIQPIRLINLSSSCDDIQNSPINMSNAFSKEYVSEIKVFLL